LLIVDQFDSHGLVDPVSGSYLEWVGQAQRPAICFEARVYPVSLILSLEPVAKKANLN
jgi:hypothetical protein